MFKPVMQVAATGVVAFLLWKLAAVLLLPLLGVAVGIAAFVIKLGFIALILFVLWLVFRRRNDRSTATG
jgi:hypothetical protein